MQDLESPRELSGWVDAIVAIAATLLVLDLRLPEHSRGGLGHALAAERQHYAAYALGYVLVVLGWINTKRLLRYLIGVDYYLTLMVILTNGAWTLSPFAVGTLASAGHDVHDLSIAVRLMSGIITGSMIIWACAVTYASRRGLWQPGLDETTRAIWIPGSQLVWIVPAAAFAASYLSPYAALGLVVLYALIAAMPVPGRLETAERRDHIADPPRSEGGS
ncbi:hypothetical protein GCM10022242_42110 [Nocardioides panacisoli]|uniref:DUF1211 domain-containing protein n=2 Tax=Nocardioides panacisoli TaxID=627624 RepID=A0ABP7J7Z9_9ACTN